MKIAIIDSIPEPQETEIKKLTLKPLNKKIAKNERKYSGVN